MVPRPSVGRSHSSYENRIRRADVEVLFPSERLRIPVNEVEIDSASSEGSELSKLADFLVHHRVGIIARYHVQRTPPQQTTPADPHKDAAR